MSDMETPEPDEKAAGEEAPPGYKRVSYFVSVVMMAVAIVTALTTWEQRIYIDELSNDVIAAEFNATQARITSQAQARQNYVIYSYYLVNQTLADELVADEVAAAAHPALLDQADLLASNNLYFFPGRYLRPDGSYDFDRNASEVMADLGRRNTLDSAPLRHKTDSQLERKLWYIQVEFILGISLAVLAFEKVFFWKRWLTRYTLITVGVVLFVVGTVQYLMLSPNPLSALRLG